MSGHWTFAQKIGAGFALVVLLAVLMGGVAVHALRTVVADHERLQQVSVRPLIEAQRLNTELERKSSAARALLLTREDRFAARLREARNEFLAGVERLRGEVDSTDEQRLIDALTRAEDEHQQALDRIVAQVRSGAAAEIVVRAFDDSVVPRRDDVDRAVRAFVGREEQLLDAARKATDAAAARAIALTGGIALAVVVLSTAIALLLGRALSRQIGAAVSHVQSSSVELQAAANQQTTGAREQATAVSEISTTITELLATSRQIADSTQRVAQIAEQTAEAARGGSGQVDLAHESIAGIRRQVDTVVGHMLDLGRKSQQIGAVLEIVAELAEQTNILAINATIEAAGAGESGKRFAVVADEIRALADRVGGSAKEIRALIEDVRGAVHTTVMATETGSKAVDAGTQQFAEVAASFKRIAALVVTTTEAAREIELSTKQQSSAVEQVNVAIGSVAQTTRETEVSSGQTLATVSQLASLSRDLLRLVRPQAAAA